MRGWKRRDKGEDAEPVQAEEQRPAVEQDTSLPGSAGYSVGSKQRKNHMPDVRFTFVRPDGKDG